MNKKGFTLAEVLVTLAVIGVVVAMTLPNLIHDTSSAQIGPKLAKAVSVFEQANENLLNENSVDLLTDISFLEDNTYIDNLSDFMKISQITYNERTAILSKDGTVYILDYAGVPENVTDRAHKQRIGDVTIDINGVSEPNNDGTDVFYFSWWNDGSLRPQGGTNWNGNANSQPGGPQHWSNNCPANAVPRNSAFCAGHIFENNLKVLYK